MAYYKTVMGLGLGNDDYMNREQAEIGWLIISPACWN